ncbi:Fc receptor, IgE, high affinity I, gamma polypeptide like isoform X2 [Cynoglossus semilaevis]|uniref:Fc receptor, IgE, high affinity I, gamma polypeptide like isoform X2 n=1 Tax=Cynoglossus semilaevis TaxID=244447 RepID=UPI0007DC95B3|nr:high affinity immunoglobulin epsilon receptor subunit gamma-like isoform X2 [Cynoglossus semilaevis]
MRYPGFAEDCGDMNICYILDGVLVVYGVILTVLYCRLMRSKPAASSRESKQPVDAHIYAGLAAPSNDTYETIRMDKKTVF